MFRTRLALAGVPALAVSALFLAPASAPADWPYGSVIYQRDFPNAPPPSWAGYPLDDTNPGYYGGGRYREYYSFGRGGYYSIADFPPPLPNYNPRPLRAYRVAAAPQTLGGRAVDQPAPALLEMHVPADAEVWLEGAKTKQSGTDRTFVSPPLIPVQDFAYEIRVRWSENGRRIEQKRSVTVRAGEHLALRFPLSEAGPEVLPTPMPVRPPQR